MSVTREVASDSESALILEQQKPPNTMAIHSNYNADEAFRNRSKSTMMQQNSLDDVVRRELGTPKSKKSRRTKKSKNK